MKKLLKSVLLIVFLCSAFVVVDAPDATADPGDIIIIAECSGSGTTCIINIGSPHDGEYKLDRGVIIFE